jgi:methylmalonyl-CoA mutase
MWHEFPPIGTAEWHKKISTDLKGLKNYADLTWQTPDGLLVAPFYRADEVVAADMPVALRETWQLHEIIAVTAVKQANDVALQALAGGADSLQFVLDRALTKPDLHRLLDSVFVELIHLSFSGQWVWQHADILWTLYRDLLTERGVLSPTISCSFEVNPLNNEVLARLNADTSNYFGIKIVNLYGAGSVAKQLEGLVHTTKHLIANTPELASRIVWSLPIGSSFMLEIAKMRAARILWATHIDAATAPVLHAFTSPMSLTDDVHYNKIVATTQAMSAIIGGADRVTVTPSDTKTGTTSNDARRIARNVQHILRLESHFDTVQDPTAGSYYVEHLTNQLCAISKPS